MAKTPMGYITIRIPIMADLVGETSLVKVHVSKNPDYTALMQKEELPAEFSEVVEARYLQSLVEVLKAIAGRNFQIEVE